MKKVIFILLILASCQKADMGISGTVWVGENESHYSKEEWDGYGGHTFTETTTTHEYTLKFTTETAGTIKTVSVSTTDGVTGLPVESIYPFTYTYEQEFMRGSIVYDVGSNFYLSSSFEIRSGFLCEDSELTGDVEYRRK